MELHSYAKRKASKKWTNEQKLKLMDARIRYDALFAINPTNSVVPWKKILAIAKLDDYNVFFVRKQWSNMVARYKQYKQNRLDNTPSTTIDDEMILKISQEWEFFQPIHNFMCRKTTNLHSYALQMQSEPQLETPHHHHQTQVQAATAQAMNIHHPIKRIQQQQEHSNSSIERNNNNTISSDTNEEPHVQTEVGDKGQKKVKTIYSQILNTDHDLYSKQCVNNQICYFADDSEDTKESMMTIDVQTTVLNADQTHQKNGDSQAFETNAEEPQLKKIKLENSGVAVKDVEDISLEMPAAAMSGMQKRLAKSSGTLNERDKYYRHKRRFHRRLERRFDTILNVVGQIVKTEYPSIDVSALLGTVVTAGRTVVEKMFSSSDDDDDDEQEEEEEDEDEDDNNNKDVAAEEQI